MSSLDLLLYCSTFTRKSKNTGTSIEQVVQKANKVIQDLPHEYGQIDENVKSWDALIAYLYMKYLKELGILQNV